MDPSGDDNKTESEAPTMPKGDAKSNIKPRGRMSVFAFFIKSCREEHKKDHPEENVVFTEFSKQCAERWKTLTDREKERFHDMADVDKKRYDREMKDYKPSEIEKGKPGKRGKHIKDPNAPKRPLPAFFMYSSDERSKIKHSNINYNSSELGRMWTQAHTEVKKVYQELAKEDKARYVKELEEYKKTGKITYEPEPPVVKTPPEEEEEEDAPVN